jgi:hypothetical protein
MITGQTIIVAAGGFMHQRQFLPVGSLMRDVDDDTAVSGFKAKSMDPDWPARPTIGHR